MANKDNKNLDLKYLDNQIEVKTSEMSNLESSREQCLSKIKELEKVIAISHKTIFDRFIEIISMGFVNYDKKYFELINKHKQTILKLNDSSSAIHENLKSTKEEIVKLQNQLKNALNSFKIKLGKFQDSLLKLANHNYINDYTRAKLVVNLGRIILDNEKYLLHENIKSFLKDIVKFNQSSEKWARRQNAIFLQNEKIQEKLFFDSIESNPLTKKQKDAVLVNENNNLILAGAGSGKTSVIVAKVSYLIKKHILHPNEILILAFNKKAQQELEDRFKEKGISVKIKTFHSFGLSVIAEAMSQKPNLCPMTESTNNMTKFIKDTIHNLMPSMNVFLEDFITFVAYFRIPYKSESEFNSLGEYYDYQKSYDMKTLKHEVEVKAKRQGEDNLTTLKEETVKSHQELVIANFLILNGIKYLYEHPYKHKTDTTEKRQYKPDFYLPDYDIYIEHFGIDRENNTAPYVDKDEYLKSMEWKVLQHQENNTKLVQTFSYEFTENDHLDLLKEKLLKRNVIFRKLEYAEISELLKQSDEENKFTKLFTTFLTHYKSNMHSLDEIKQKSKGSERTSLFIKLFEFIFDEYEKFQERNNCIDFDDMIVKALHAIEDGKYKHGFKHIFIDEFQDISTTRATLIKKLLSCGDVSLTAVGDDWQSINRFAGSNIKIIQDFKKTFGVSETIVLDYTFRFDNIVARIASDFVQKNPYQIKKSISTLKTQQKNKFSIVLFWSAGNSKEDLEKIIDRIAKKENGNPKQILILARYNFLLDNEFNIIENKHKNLNMVFSTIHRSKGKEADYVVVLNLDKGKLGFPSKIENDPILNIVIPEGDDFEDAEERRLFYVALTRTKGAVFLSSDRYNRSIFIDEMIENYKDDIFFNDPKIRILNCPECKTGVLKKRSKSSSKSNYFYGCNNFPRCKYRENVHYCPECKEEMFKDEEEKIARCSNDNCDFETMLCIECSGYMIGRQGRYGAFLGCTNYPKCNHTSEIRDKSSVTFDNLF